MICEHDRLARQCRECTNIDDLAELESAHRMMAARNERLQKENDELEKEVERLKTFLDFMEKQRISIGDEPIVGSGVLLKQNAELASELNYVTKQAVLWNEKFVRIKQQNAELAEVLRHAQTSIQKNLSRWNYKDEVSLYEAYMQIEGVLRKYGLGNDQQVQLAINDLCKKYGLEGKEE